jgi:hypothetical protein
MREILEDCHKITQGTIFSNAKSNDFHNNVYGILVNGRCDLEHLNHYDNYLYLPIIPYKLWESKIAINKVLERKHKDIIKFLKSYEEKFSYSALLYMPEHINETIEQYIKKPKDQEKIKNALFFLKVYEKYEKNMDYLKKETDDFKTYFSSDFNAIRKDLIDNKLPDSVYLENVDIQDQNKQQTGHYVVLITEIHSIPKKAILMLENGIDLESHEELKQFFGNDQLIIPCSTLTSPYIEHLIQKMVDLFRVGIDRADNFEIQQNGGTSI